MQSAPEKRADIAAQAHSEMHSSGSIVPQQSYRHSWTLPITSSASLPSPLQSRHTLPQTAPISPKVHSTHPSTSPTAAAHHRRLPRSYTYFSSIVKIPLCFLFADLLVSTFVERAKFNIYLSMGFYGVQLALILANLLLLFIAFTNTQPFRAGLLRIMVNCMCCSLPVHQSTGARSQRGEFNSAVWYAVFYFIVCLATRIWETYLLWDCWKSICLPFGTLGFRIFYIFFRMVSLGYYYYFKRAVFALCEPKYYEIDSAWLREKLRNL